MHYADGIRAMASGRGYQGEDMMSRARGRGREIEVMKGEETRPRSAQRRRYEGEDEDGRVSTFRGGYDGEGIKARK